MNYYGDAIINPNSYVFSESKDAMKNYFTYASHLKENGVINSNIMNYPYGENFLYLDCQPLLTVLFKILSGPFPFILNYSVGIINFLMIFSMVLSAIFLYLIFIEFKIINILSITGAIAIAILAPQIFRTSGHLALSYSFFIPLTWYLFIRYSKSRFQLKWSIILFINNLGWFFVHAYLGMMLTSFLFLSYIFNLVFFGRSKYRDIKQWLYFSLQTLLPVFVFWLFITLTDKHVGRTNNPSGFLYYVTNFQSVFLPNHSPLKPHLESLFVIEQNWEGWAYIGAGTVFAFLLFLINRIIRLFKKKSFADDSSLLKNQFIVPALFSSLVLLLLSMGYPFKWNMEYLLDWFPVLKSFRGIGRFAWVFYYVTTVSSIYFVYLIFDSNKRKAVFLILALIIPLSYIWEGIPYHAEMGKSSRQHSNQFDKNQLSHSITSGLRFAIKDSYQAILPLPYYNIGSENFTRFGTNKIYKLSMLMSYHSEIPLFANYSTNTSISESKNLIQVLSPGFYPKVVINDIKSEKPFLIIYSNEELTVYEQAILDKGTKIYSDNDYSLYSVTKDELFRNTSAEEIRNFEQLRDRLTDVNGFLLTVSDSIASVVDTNAVISYNSYEDTPQVMSFRGKGAYYGEMKNYNHLATFDPSRLNKDKEYVASYWMYNDGENYGQDALNSMTFIESKDKDGKVINWFGMTNPARSFVINGSWSLIELTFKIPDGAKSITICLKDDDDSKIKFHVDDILIRAKDTDVYMVMKEENGSVVELFKNNHRISL